MKLENGWETSFLEVVQNSEFKKDAILSQLLFADSEEVEELVDDYGYEEIIEREHDDELAGILGEELSVSRAKRILISTARRKTYFIRKWIRFSCVRLDCAS